MADGSQLRCSFGPIERREAALFFSSSGVTCLEVGCADLFAVLQGAVLARLTKTSQAQMIEQQVEIVVLVADIEVILAAYESEALAEFENHFA